MKNDSLIKEYECTQEMIRHYEDLNMRFGAMTLSAELIFIGLSFGLLSKEKAMFMLLFPIVIIFVAGANLLVHLWFRRHRSISQIKINRILEIEKELGWKQFYLVNEAIKSNSVESKPVRRMIHILHIGLPVLLIIAYFLVIVWWWTSPC